MIAPAAFDVLIPYWGDPALLRAAVRSVLAQDGDDWRLTVVDDGYPDRSVPDWFAGLDHPRVRYLRNRQNLGVTGNFNRCLELAEAPRTVLMGCDDLMLPGYLAALRGALARHPHAGIVQPGVEVVDGRGAPSRPLADRVKRAVYAPRAVRAGHPAEYGGEELARSLLRGDWLYFPSLCWRTEAVRRFGFRGDLGVIQDLALVIDLVAAGERLAVTPEVVFRYRRHGASESSASAVRGDRFAEARRYFAETAQRMDGLGWRGASGASRRYLSSRLHAASLIPGALARGGSGLNALARHAFGGPHVLGGPHGFGGPHG